jgi:Asp-tRNA(Asn)/Glu-tRNA(Gln) amidotransferase C subunit
MHYFEVSSKFDTNVDQMFKMIIAEKAMRISKVKSPLDSSRLLLTRPEKKGKCAIM